MAYCMTRLQSLSAHLDRSSLSLDCLFTGTDIPDGSGVLQTDALVVLTGAESAVQLRTLMSAAVSEVAVANGFTCLGGNMVLPTFQKG